MTAFRNRCFRTVPAYRFAAAACLLVLVAMVVPATAWADGGYQAGQDTDKSPKRDKSDKGSRYDAPETPMTAYEGALKFIQKNQCDKAQEILDPMVKQGPGNEVALLDLGYCYLQAAKTKSDPVEAQQSKETGVGWILRAGNAGLRRAEEELVRQYLEGEVLIANPIEAAKWYMLWKANRSGYAIAPPEFDEKLEKILQSTLTRDDWLTARQRALEWRPVYQ